MGIFCFSANSILSGLLVFGERRTHRRWEHLQVYRKVRCSWCVWCVLCPGTYSAYSVQAWFTTAQDESITRSRLTDIRLPIHSSHRSCLGELLSQKGFIFSSCSVSQPLSAVYWVTIRNVWFYPAIIKTLLIHKITRWLTFMNLPQNFQANLTTSHCL